jgi:hypothetical protein
MSASSPIEKPMVATNSPMATIEKPMVATNSPMATNETGRGHFAGNSLAFFALSAVPRAGRRRNTLS